MGDSFVKRLKKFHDFTYRGTQLKVKGVTLDVCGYPGANVMQLQSYLRCISVGEYSLIMLISGSNDLCALNRTLERVVNDLTSLARFLTQERQVQTVIIAQILQRTKSHVKFTQISLNDYNNREYFTFHGLSQSHVFLETRSSGRPSHQQKW